MNNLDANNNMDKNNDLLHSDNNAQRVLSRGDNNTNPACNTRAIKTPTPACSSNNTLYNDSFQLSHIKESTQINLYVTRLLFRLGFSASTKGFNYIRDMIFYAYNDPKFKMGYLCFLNSPKKDFRGASVESSVRHAIKKAYALTGFDYLKRSINMCDADEAYVATPRQFISLVVEYLRYFWNGNAELIDM